MASESSGGNPNAQTRQEAATAPGNSTSASGGQDNRSQPATPETPIPANPFAAVKLGGAAPVNTGAGAASPHAASTTAGQRESTDNVIERLKPLQVLLGTWRGTTRKEYDGFKAVDAHEWVWDLRTNPQSPALVMQSDKSPYFRNGRVTWDAAADQYRLTTVDADNQQREFAGRFTQPVADVPGDDKKLQRTYKLEFTQTAPADDAEQWQFLVNQQENNRYLLEIDRKRGSGTFRRFDTVSTQREGTSFAINDSDYGEKTCIISEGLGTISVSYKGRDYWVCCTGCKAAFEDDPETWIARAAERAKARAMKN